MVTYRMEIGCRPGVDCRDNPPPSNMYVEVDAVPKSGDDNRVGAIGGSVGDPNVNTQHDNQPINDEGLGAKATKQLVAHQLRKGVTEAGGRRQSASEGEDDRGRRGIKCPIGSNFLFFYSRSAREEGSRENAARDWGAASPWFTGRVQKPADVT